MENETLSLDIHLPSRHHLEITEDYEGNKYNCALFFENEHVQSMNADTPEEIFNWIKARKAQGPECRAQTFLFREKRKAQGLE